MVSTGTPERAEWRRRWFFTAAAGVAGIVTVVFATLGDGVDIPAEGWAGIVIDYGHTAVWALLSAAFAVAAVRGGWQRISGVLAGIALAVYVLFVVLVLLGP